jgi:hypothetical protein
MANVKVAVCKSGKMEASTRATGRMTKPTAEEDSFTPMETHMKESGTMTKLKVVAPMSTWMAPSTSEIGKKIGSMVTALKLGLITQSMKETMKTEKNTG